MSQMSRRDPLSRRFAGLIDGIEPLLEDSKSPIGQVFSKVRTNQEPTLPAPDQIMYSQRASMLTERTNTTYYQPLTARMLNEEPVKAGLGILSEGIHR